MCVCVCVHVCVHVCTRVHIYRYIDIGIKLAS